MQDKISTLPVREVIVDISKSKGCFEWMRHAIGRGGVNANPLPENVAKGLEKLNHKKVRVFIQEFVNIYPAHGVFDWSRLDAFLESFSKIGINVVADICIKPEVLYPAIDHSIFMPNDVDEWKSLIRAMVKRYSVDKKIITDWEILNEPEIGEVGATPFLVKDPESYYNFYKLTADAILDVCPDCRIGGPASDDSNSKVLEGLIRMCSENNVRLDFVSWHIYHDNPLEYSKRIEQISSLLKKHYPDAAKRPEQTITEYSIVRFWENRSHESTNMSKWAACVAAIIMEMIRAGLDWSFYYDLWEQYIVPEEIGRFMTAETTERLYKWCNEEPLFLALFGMGNEVHPPYFVFDFLSKMAEEMVITQPDKGIYSVAASEEGRVTVLLSNYEVGSTPEFLTGLKFTGLKPGLKKMTVYRIDNDRKWDCETFEIKAAEERTLYVKDTFRPLIYTPADSVVFIELKDVVQ